MNTARMDTSVSTAGVAERWAPREVRTARMVLRPLRAADRGALIALMETSWGHLSPWFPSAAECGMSEGPAAYAERALARDAAALEAGTAVRLAGFDERGRIAGLFNLNNLVRGVGQMADAGWLVSAEHAGRGLATEGVAALLDLAFAPLPGGVGLHRVQAGIIPRNARSIRVAEKCRMRREGLALRFVRIAGVWEDHLIYARTAEE